MEASIYTRHSKRHNQNYYTLKPVAGSKGLALFKDAVAYYRNKHEQRRRLRTAKN